MPEEDTDTITNGVLLNRNQALQQAAQSFQSVKGKYAIQKTVREYENAMEAYRETLKNLAEEHGVDMNEGIPEDSPQEFQEQADELLQEEIEEPSYHAMTQAVLDKEDEKGSNVPFEIIMALDFMIE